MSKEAVGQNGELLGSSNYWNALNRNTVLGEIMHANAPTDYYDALRRAGERASEAIDNIYQDLNSKRSVLRYLDSGERNGLVKQVKGLYDICDLTGKFAMHKDDCIRALNESDYGSFWDKRAIEESVQYIKRSNHYSAWEALDMLKEAASWGISHATGQDPKKEAYLKTIAQDKGEDFLKEVLKEYQHQQGDCDCRGQCGYSIGSNGYLDWVEADFVARSLPVSASARWGSPNYALLFQDELRSVADQLERDLDAADRSGDYITDATQTQLKAAVAELSRCGVSTHRLNDKIDKLAWFVGDDKDKIKDLQHLLNELLGGHIEEDGVWGKITEQAIWQLEQWLADLETHLRNSRNLKELDVLSAIVNILAINPLTRNAWTRIAAALLRNRKDVQRIIWRFGSEHYLKRNDYNFAAELLEHALENNPSNLYFSPSSWEAKNVIESEKIQELINDIKRQVKNGTLAGEGKPIIDFGAGKEKDLHLAFGNVGVEYRFETDEKDIYVHCKIRDEYDFSEIRSVYADAQKDIVGLDWNVPNLANDAGLLSQADGVLTPYWFEMRFKMIIPR